MARKPTAKKRTDSVELRRWCIEQAIRWPTYTRHPYAGASSISYSAGVAETVDCDLIGRAEKILKWVTA